MCPTVQLAFREWLHACPCWLLISIPSQTLPHADAYMYCSFAVHILASKPFPLHEISNGTLPLSNIHFLLHSWEALAYMLNQRTGCTIFPTLTIKTEGGTKKEIIDRLSLLGMYTEFEVPFHSFRCRWESNTPSLDWAYIPNSGAWCCNVRVWVSL